ncbi:MAG: methyltransferase domain-containing protein [bacterium]|nr:methyltransferase domain-containing protein [bacterium]
MESLGIEEGMKLAEFGSGTGLFSLAAAQRVGRDGKVYAIDVQKVTLDSLRSRARLEGIFNLEALWVDLERMGALEIADNSLDAVLVPNMLFQSQKKDAILREALRIAKPGGQVMVIDWYPDKAIYGNEMGWPVDQAAMRGIAEKSGLTWVRDVQTGSTYHYGLLFRK